MQEANIQLAFSPKLEIDSAIKQTYTDEKITNFCKEWWLNQIIMKKSKTRTYNLGRSKTNQVGLRWNIEVGHMLEFK